MPSLLTPRRSFTKPGAGARINYGHPLARGLIGAWLFNEGAGRPWHQGPVPIGAPAATVGGAGWENINGSLGGLFASTVVGYGDVDLGLVNKGALTVVMSIRPSSLTQVAGILNKRSSFGGQASYSFGFGYNATSFFCGAINSAVQYSFTTSGWSTTNYQQVTMTYNVNNGAGSRLQCWRNNVAIAATVDTEGNSAVQASTSPIELGRVNNGTLYYSGGVEYIYFYNVTFTTTEIAQIYADPYAFVVMPGKRVWLPDTSGVAATVKYRKTLSSLGTRTGSRQAQGS